MKKLLASFIILLPLLLLGQAPPLQHNPWTTNPPAALPTPSAVITNSNTGTLTLTNTTVGNSTVITANQITLGRTNNSVTTSLHTITSGYQVDVSTNGQSNLMRIGLNGQFQLGNNGANMTTSNGVMAAVSFAGDGSAVSNLNASSISSGTVPLGNLPSYVVTNGALPYFGASGAANGPHVLFNANGLPETLLDNPYGNFLEGSQWSLSYPLASSNSVTLNDGTLPAVLPMASYGNENPAGYLTGRLNLWTWYLSTDVSDNMINCLRVCGVVGNWTGDNRAAILKGMASIKLGKNGGGAFILETMAAAGSPGTHGTFNNSIYVATNGLGAYGNLTDTADNNQNTLQPPAWITIYSDGSAWSKSPSIANSSSVPHAGGAPAKPGLCVVSSPLVTTAVASAQEYDGTNWYLTDDSLSRWREVRATTNGAVLFPTNVPAFALPPGYCGYWPSNFDLYYVTPLKTNLIVLGH